MKPCIVLQSDFGLSTGLPASMTAVIAKTDPEIRIYDLCHEVREYDIRQGASILASTFPYWPDGTIFVSVVDPGVGTDRRSCVALMDNGSCVVTPDNGTLSLLFDRISEVREIDETVNRMPGSDDHHTFHGRDVYAYTAARLASGIIRWEGVGPLFGKDELVNAKGRKVLVIGGGDTGSDCIGTCHRHEAVSVTQIEILPKPPEGYNPATPWPYWPQILKTTTSHEEGCERFWSLTSNRFIDDGKGNVCGVETERVEWVPSPDGGRPRMEKTGEKKVIECDMVLLAMGFLKPEHPAFGPNVFLCGDAKSGASLVVRAIASGRETAKEGDKYRNTK